MPTVSGRLHFFLKYMSDRKHAFWLCLLLFCFFSIYAFGRSELSKFIPYGITLYLSLYVIRHLSRYGFMAYLSFSFLVGFVYLPQAVIYGQLNLGVVASLFETNWSESLEYLSDLTPKAYLLACLYVALFVVVFTLHRHIEVKKTRAKAFYFAVLVVLVALLQKPFEHAYKYQNVSLDTLAETKLYPVRMLFEYAELSRDYFDIQHKLTRARNVQPTWHVEKVFPKYGTYVVVIGESMRRDYMSLYGYPVQTTPFLDRVNGTFFDRFVAAAWNTPTSLQRMLIAHDNNGETLYSNSFITLANSAGFKTYWLSNQGQMGRFDTLASSIAIKADTRYFAKKGDYETNNRSDFELLSEFDRALNDASSKPKLIVLHLMGSHSQFCNRLDDAYQIENIHGVLNQSMSCYLSSVKQTDGLLARLYSGLQQQPSGFSLMYFSDHGLSHKEQMLVGVTLKHSTINKQNYDVPLVVLSSDDQKREHIHALKSGYDLMVGLAQWMGIIESNLSKQASLFKDQQDHGIKVFDSSRWVDYSALKDDPALTP